MRRRSVGDSATHRVVRDAERGKEWWMGSPRSLRTIFPFSFLRLPRSRFLFCPSFYLNYRSGVAPPFRRVVGTVCEDRPTLLFSFIPLLRQHGGAECCPRCWSGAQAVRVATPRALRECGRLPTRTGRPSPDDVAPPGSGVALPPGPGPHPPVAVPLRKPAHGGDREARRAEGDGGHPPPAVRVARSPRPAVTWGVAAAAAAHARRPWSTGSPGQVVVPYRQRGHEPHQGAVTRLVQATNLTRTW